MPASVAGIDNPFVGLRSFEPSESLLFHGRKQHTQQLLRVLASHRLVGVIGTSGSGKSSLVKAGLLPALHRGYLRGASSRWKTAVMRPGDAPLARLAEVLPVAQPPEDIAKRLEENSAALVTLVSEQFKSNPDPDNLLLVVDQFEEIFRLHKGGERAAAFFISLLLRSRDEIEVPLFIVLTMRSEYLGNCAQYAGLAEALSEAQYLIPRLTRDQREEAIRGPLDMAGADIDDALVQQLLNDAGDDPDQLPALQHALMRLYEETPRGTRLTRERYGERLRVGRSLNFHAQAVYDDSLTAAQQKLAETVFRALTTTEDGREVRRPTKLGALCAITGAQSEDDRDDIRAVVREFSKKENSLLFSTTGAKLTDDTLVDITHESLIRQWDLLQEWVRREAESADWFARLVRSAELRRGGRGGGGLWPKPDTEFAFRRMSEEGWTPQWGDQYRPGFAEAMAFLEESRAAIEQVEENERKARERELQAARDLAAAKERELVSAQELAETRELKLKIARRGRNRLMVALAGLTAATIGLCYFAWLFRQERKLTDEIRKIGAGSTLETIAELRNRLAKAEGTKTGVVKMNPVDGLRYVFIPPGKFMMGCSPGDTECFDSEKPLHEVEITRGFWMGQTEVTQAAYEKVMKTNPSSFKGADRPVESVSWNDANAYCEAAGLRLPTEAEWEYAARAGSRESRYGTLDQVAWYGSNSKGQTQPVAAKSPNAWGLYDMLGNVWEWTADWYNKDYYNQKVAKDPQGPSSPTGSKVLRGGAWNNFPQGVRVSVRGWNEPSGRDSNIGFRCAGELR